MGQMTSLPTASEAGKELACGHTVAEGDHYVWHHEAQQGLCRECHTPFRLRDYPEIIGEVTRNLHTRRGGQTTKYTGLVGIDRLGRAIYHTARGNVEAYVPRDDNRFAPERPDDPSPRRYTKAVPGGCPPSVEYVTMSHGENIVRSETLANLGAGESIGEWVESNAEVFGQLRPAKVERFDLSDTFSAESGCRLS